MQQRASASFGSRTVLSTPCAVSIRYMRNKGRSDSANIVGGILDGLQGIVFENDNQVVEIFYTEGRAAHDSFQVVVTELEAN